MGKKLILVFIVLLAGILLAQTHTIPNNSKNTVMLNINDLQSELSNLRNQSVIYSDTVMAGTLTVNYYVKVTINGTTYKLLLNK
jgi:hypothetical protein